MTNNPNSRVDILLATFNGENYLPDLLDSILAQSYGHWHLFIRDDGSSDNTSAILSHYKKHYDHKMSIVANENTSLGSCQNFGRLLECSTADYLMFCDQDDVWISQKIELMLHALQETERQFGKQTPVLVHSDLKVTTANLEIISDSFWKYQFILPEIGCRFSRLLMQNAVTGNTVIMNRSAKEHAIPIPEEAIMHDWWLALVVSAFGQIRHLPFPTVLYRQHEDNAVSAKKWGYEFIIGNIIRGHLFHEQRKRMLRRESQARCFLNRCKLRLNSEQRNAAITMANLSKLSPIARRRAIWRYQLLMMGFLRNAVLFLTV